MSPFVQLLWEKGTAYEKEVISNLDVPFVDLSIYAGDEKERLTWEAIRRGEPLIYSGRISADDLLGDPGDHEDDAVERLGANLRLEAATGHGRIYGAANVQATRQDYDETGPDDTRARLDGRTVRFAGGGDVAIGTQVRLATDLATTAVDNQRAAWAYPAPAFTPVPAEKDYRGREDYATARATVGDGRVDRIHAGGQVTAGIDLRRASAQQETDGVTEWDDHDGQLGLWGHGLIGSRRFVLSGALRRDEHSDFDGVTTGRLAAGMTPDASITLRGAYATGYRAPSLYQRYGSESGDFPYRGNPDLQPETSRSYELGVDARPTGDADRLHLGLTGFRTEFSDKIDYDYSGFPVYTYRNLSGEAWTRGIESEAEAGDLAGSGVDLRLWYTFTDTDDGAGEPLGYVPRHLGGARVGIHGDAGDWRWRAGASAERTSGYRAYLTSISGLGTMPGYWLASVDAGATWRGTWDIGLSLRNALDEDYAVTEGYSTMPRALFATLTASF